MTTTLPPSTNTGKPPFGSTCTLNWCTVNHPAQSALQQEENMAIAADVRRLLEQTGDVVPDDAAPFPVMYTVIHSCPIGQVTTDGGEPVAIVTMEQAADQESPVLNAQVERDGDLDVEQARALAGLLLSGASSLRYPGFPQRPKHPLFAMPVSDECDSGSALYRSGSTGAPDPNDPDDLLSLYGYCMRHCEADDARTIGLTVAQHGGPACVSSAAGYLDGSTAEGDRFGLAVELVAPYRHGTYRRADVYGDRREVLIALSMHCPEVVVPAGGDDSRSAYVSVGEARRLIAVLQHAVDSADGLDRPLNDAKARREADR